MSTHSLSADLVVGKKAETLYWLKNAGFSVPPFFVLEQPLFSEILSQNNATKQLHTLLRACSKENVLEISCEIKQLFSSFTLPESILTILEQQTQSNESYAVRSSGLKEDLATLSFAGQYETFLNVSGMAQLQQKILECFCSLYAENVLSYALDHQLNLEELGMGVIIQQMVSAEKSGVVFTVNPISGNDKEMIIEATEGLGEDFVSGKVIPTRYLWHWFDEKFNERPTKKLLTEEELNQITSEALKVQIYFGHPCDIEFAFAQGKLFLLQSRPITKLLHTGINEQWTTANFKDGGVSSQVCISTMWSLYEYIWDNTLRDFILTAKLLKPNELKKLSGLYYGRPYWNVGTVKKAMQKVPGYRERDFDEDLGITIPYDGSGITTPFSLSTIFAALPIALQHKKMLATWMEQLPSKHKTLLQTYDAYEKKLSTPVSGSEIQKIWYTLTFEDYYKSENTYFYQIFLNTVQQALIKEKLLHHINKEAYVTLLTGLEDVSHLRPHYATTAIVKKIVQDKESLQYWLHTPSAEIHKDMLSKAHRYYLPDVQQWFQEFGYHSDRELDIAHPCFIELPEKIIERLRDQVIQYQNGFPEKTAISSVEMYQEQLADIQEKLQPKTYRKLYPSVEKLRHLLWWREELKDISTRYYYLIRMFTLKLASFYVEEKILRNQEDIWHLKIEDIWAFIDQKISKDDLQQRCKRNQQYYMSFRNFKNANEIGARYDQKETGSSKQTDKIKGIGCNPGSITGRARVMNHLDTSIQLSQGDILVTKFTDTGWTSTFSKLSGLVTEHGGLLCHGAVVSREYGIPCIMCVPEATKIIPDGSHIQIDGTSGEIVILNP